jgi:uncharacterized protein
MSFPVLARVVFSALREFDVIDFIWHGGETTLLPISFYKKAMLAQARFRRPGQSIRNIIQTNGTRVSEEWVRFLKTYEFSAGISIDGPPEIHDRYRRYAGGRPSFDDVVRGIDILKKYKVPFTVLTVIDEATLELGADRLFDFFLELGVANYSCIAAKPVNQPEATPGSTTSHYTDPEQICTFLMRLHDRWLEHGDPSLCIRELNAIRNGILDEKPKTCAISGRCFGRYFLVEPNGDIAHCDLFQGDPRYTLGNIMETDFAELLTSDKLTQLREQNQRARAVMREQCSEFDVCQGGCPHDRYTSARHNLAHSDECCGLRSLIEHVRERMVGESRMLTTPVSSRNT